MPEQFEVWLLLAGVVFAILAAVAAIQIEFRETQTSATMLRLAPLLLFPLAIVCLGLAVWLNANRGVESEPAPSDGPVGVVAPWPFLSVDLPVGWVRCDGAPAPEKTSRVLLKFLKTVYGVDSDGRPLLPNLEGKFLRGVHQDLADLSNQRRQPPPGTNSSHTGPGSTQGPATGIPVATAAIRVSLGIGRDEHFYGVQSKAVETFTNPPAGKGFASASVREGGDPQLPLPLPELRWDSETRPTNVLVHWIIRIY